MKALCCIAILLVACCANADGRLVTVRGEAALDVVPDIVRIKIRISSRGEAEVAKAKAEVDAISARAVAALTQVGVDKADVTSGTLKAEAEDIYEHGKPRCQGHVVTREINVVLRHLDAYNATVQALIDSGVSEIVTVQPDVSNEDELKHQALSKALADARSSASYMASQLDARVTRVHQIGRQEVQGDTSLEEVVVTARRRTAKDADKSLQYEFAPGTIKITSSVYVEFEIE